MKSLFSTGNQEILDNIYIGITLPSLNSDGTILESPLRWLQLPRDLRNALAHDHLEPVYMLDKLINVESSKHRQIRLARIVAVTTSDFDHMRAQTSVPLKRKTNFFGARAQFIYPEKLLDPHVYDTLTFLYHDHPDDSKQAIYKDAALWQRLMMHRGNSPALQLSTSAEIHQRNARTRMIRKSKQAISSYVKYRVNYLI
jgi:hypothetical protein